MAIPPLVYVGPTLREDEVRQALPGAEVRGPLRRGELYRDRMLRYSVFVVIDGVFHQQDAIPPREVVDVLNDGAWIVGASSMGALRAAECWPAGMQGVGAIYRLFRRGSLGSDDEVAVAFDPNEPSRASVPLINVRYAVSRAVRHGHVDRERGERIVEIAVACFYADRRWRSLLARAGVDDANGELEARLSGLDLKRADALRALRRVSRRLSREPELAYQPRRSRTPFAPAEEWRERPHAALDGRDVDDVKRDVVRFLWVGGRLGRLLAVPPAPTEAVSSPRDFADRVWTELRASGDLDAEIFRWRAIRAAAQRARRAGVAPSRSERDLAAAEIAREHGEPSWVELEGRIREAAAAWPWFLDYRDELALAKRVREELFSAS